ncbi:MAG: hypothetical protein ACRCXZ_09185 [Patescibacteria group bacterium]
MLKNKALFASLLAINCLLTSASFVITSSATQIACETSKSKNMIPTNRWTGILDKKASKEELSSYCFETNVLAPAFISSIVLLQLIVVEAGLWLIIMWLINKAKKE